MSAAEVQALIDSKPLAQRMAGDDQIFPRNMTTRKQGRRAAGATKKLLTMKTFLPAIRETAHPTSFAA
jgi:hypothetical protein